MKEHIPASSLCWVLLAAAALGQVAPASSPDWASYNQDVRGWRYNAAETSLSPENAGELIQKWRFPRADAAEMIGVVHATPVVVEGCVYFGTASFPAFYKLRPDGTLAWVYHLGTGESSTEPLPVGGVNRINAEHGVVASALVTDERVYFGDSAGVFYALDRYSGDEVWKVDTRDARFPGHHPINVIHASAIWVNGMVIVGGGGYEHAHPLDPDYACCTGRGFVVAFDGATGDVVWKYEVGEVPQAFDPPVVIEDAKGRHEYHFGPSTSSVWSTPSFDAESGAVFFGTDVHNSPRRPTPDNPRFDTKYSASVVAVDAATGREKWVAQINRGDIFNHTMSGYDPNTGRYKDCSIGDTPKVYSIDVDGEATTVVGVGCKNGGFYVLKAGDGEVLSHTPVHEGPPKYPLEPSRDPRMIALPSPIGGIQTGCATDGESVFTNGIDWLSLNTLRPGAPEAGRVVSVSADLQAENWRHERPKTGWLIGRTGDPVASGVALGGGLACFTTTVSQKLVVLDAASGDLLKELDIGLAWTGPSISRGRIYCGSGSILFLGSQLHGAVYSFGLPGEDEVDRLGAGAE